MITRWIGFKDEENLKQAYAKTKAVLGVAMRRIPQMPLYCFDDNEKMIFTINREKVHRFVMDDIDVKESPNDILVNGYDYLTDINRSYFKEDYHAQPES